MATTTKNRWVIVMEGNAYTFYIQDISRNNEPCFTADIEEAMGFNSQARAFIGIEKVKGAGFTMELRAEPLEISYSLGVY